MPVKIYKSTNWLNGLIYLGQTEKDDPNYYGSGIIIKRAIEKDGIENFKKDILCECSNKLIADVVERFAIKYNNSQDRNVGYNIADGGEGGALYGMKGKHHSNETKRKMSEASSGKNNGMYNKKHKTETIKKIKEAFKGRKPWNKGLTKQIDKRLVCSIEHRNNISIALKGKKHKSYNSTNRFGKKRPDVSVRNKNRTGIKYSKELNTNVY